MKRIILLFVLMCMPLLNAQHKPHHKENPMKFFENINLSNRQELKIKALLFDFSQKPAEGKTKAPGPKYKAQAGKFGHGDVFDAEVKKILRKKQYIKFLENKSKLMSKN